MKRRSKPSTPSGTDADPASPPKRPLLARALTPAADDAWTKDELSKVLHFGRLLFGLVLGVVFGVLPVEGTPGFLAFFGLGGAGTYVYVTGFLGLDESDFGQAGELIMDGMMPSMGMFLLSWITVFTQLHGS